MREIYYKNYGKREELLNRFGHFIKKYYLVFAISVTYILVLVAMHIADLFVSVLFGLAIYFGVAYLVLRIMA